MTQMRSAFCTVDSRWAMTSVVRFCVNRAKRLLHQPLRFGVERARRLVEQQDRRILEDGAGERQALALAARQPQAAVADLGVVALRLRHDELVRRRRLRPRPRCPRCGAPSRPSAMLARMVSSNSVTSWLTMAMASRSEASVTSRMSWPSMVMRPLSTSNSRGTRLMHGRLAGAGAADQRHRLAARHVEREIR